MNTKKYKTLFSFVLLLGFQMVCAAELDGETIPSDITYQGSTFVINGCGTREMLWHKLYQASLYLNEKTSNIEKIMNQNTAKLLRLQVLYEKNLPDEIPNIWQEPLEEEISKELFKLLQNLYSDLNTRDVLLFIYDPDSGTKVSKNGNTLVTATDSVLMDTLLENWLGDEPVSSNLKRLLLDKDCP